MPRRRRRTWRHRVQLFSPRDDDGLVVDGVKHPIGVFLGGFVLCAFGESDQTGAPILLNPVSDTAFLLLQIHRSIGAGRKPLFS